MGKRGECINTDSTAPGNGGYGVGCNRSSLHFYRLDPVSVQILTTAVARDD